MTIDYSNKYIGVARLRQHRSDNSTCSFPGKMAFLNISCISDFSDGPVYGNFSEEWRHENESDPTSPMDESWKYTRTVKAGTLTHVGKDHAPYGVYTNKTFSFFN